MHHEEAQRLGDAGLGTAAVGAAAVAGGALSLDIPCPFLAITGLPCPGCGMTRLADSVLHLDLVGATMIDPIGIALMAVIGVLAFIGVAHRVGFAISVPAGSWRAVRLILAAALGLRWLGTLTGVVPFVG